MKPRNADMLLRAMAVVAVAFGLLTIRSGGTTLFGGPPPGNRPAPMCPSFSGSTSPPASRMSLPASGSGCSGGWAVWLAAAIAAATLLVFAAFGVHVLSGGAYETRTVAAMTLRSVVWLAIAWLAARRVRLPR